MKISTTEIQKYIDMQDINRETIEFLKDYIKEGVSEEDIAKKAEEKLKSKGVNSFWYHGIGAFVFVGERTTISISGRDYKPSTTKVKQNDVVTVDLSPEIEKYWGDFARTFVVHDGVVIGINSNEIAKNDSEIYQGIITEEKLHTELKNIISEESTFEEIFIKMNSLIEEFNFINLDFNNNLGHTIEKNKNHRLYIEKGNKTKFKDIKFFTFEPHIQQKKGKLGFKRENIYYFQNGVLKMI